MEKRATFFSNFLLRTETAVTLSSSDFDIVQARDGESCDIDMSLIDYVEANYADFAYLHTSVIELAEVTSVAIFVF